MTPSKYMPDHVRQMTPTDYMRQAHMTAAEYMNHGIKDISDAFNVPMFSDRHVTLCKAFLPSYMKVAAQDYEGSIRQGLIKGKLRERIHGEGDDR